MSHVGDEEVLRRLNGEYVSKAEYVWVKVKAGCEVLDIDGEVVDEVTSGGGVWRSIVSEVHRWKVDAR